MVRAQGGNVSLEIHGRTFDIRVRIQDIGTPDYNIEYFAMSLKKFFTVLFILLKRYVSHCIADLIYSYLYCYSQFTTYCTEELT